VSFTCIGVAVSEGLHHADYATVVCWVSAAVFAFCTGVLWFLYGVTTLPES
jgi:hypothetical protein